MSCNMKVINQRSDFDCVIACLSMFFGLDYDGLLNNYFKGYKFDKPVSDDQEKRVFTAMMAKHIYFCTWSAPLKGVKAICSVPSLNLPGKIHAIYFDGNGYLDPQSGRKDRKFYEYKSSPTITGLTLDLNQPKATKCVADVLWATTYLLADGLRDITPVKTYNNNKSIETDH